MAKSTHNDGAEFSWRSEAYAWFVVGLLVLSFTFAMIDRMILTLLVEPLKADFGLTDTQISLLHGLAFTLLYVIVGIPMGWLVDRFSRRTIAGVSVAVWSLMTVFCGFSGNFVQLFLSRMGVGIGEAGISPAANSLIADYFPSSRLSLPITLYSVGGAGGVGLALIFSGTVVDYLGQLGQVTLPLMGEIHAWQASFFVAGLPGLLIGAAYLLVKEPPRRGRKAVEDATDLTVSDTLTLLKQRTGFLVPHFLASATCALVVLSIHSWMPTLLIRSHGVGVAKAGLFYGLAVLIGGIGGLIGSGMISDWLARRGRSDSHIVTAIACTVLAILPAAIAPLSSNLALTVILAGISVLGLSSAIALAPVALPAAIPNEMRGQVYALYLLVVSILGYAVGPVLVALLTDEVFQDDMKIGWSMAIVAAAATPVAAGLWVLSRRQFLKFNRMQA